MRIETALTPADIAHLPDLAGETCVVFDILRATSSLVTAAAHGAARIFPVATREEALALKEQLPGALLCGERHGDIIPGFDLGNSPSEYCDCRGCDIISTTTNGTVALKACESASVILASSFLNLDATADFLRRSPPATLRILCAGTFANFAFEDGLAAGALIDRLGARDLSDSSLAVRDLFIHHRADWQTIVRTIGNGKALMRAGRADDITWAMRCDIYPIVLAGNGRFLEVRVFSIPIAHPQRRVL